MKVYIVDDPTYEEDAGNILGVFLDKAAALLFAEQSAKEALLDHSGAFPEIRLTRDDNEFDIEIFDGQVAPPGWMEYQRFRVCEYDVAEG